MNQVSLNKQSELFHAFTPKILNIKYQDILIKLLDNDKPSKETMNVLNNLGLSPFLSFIDHFATSYVPLRATMLQLVNSEAAKHKLNIDKYEIDN